jgi:hypothetical protein
MLPFTLPFEIFYERGTLNEPSQISSHRQRHHRLAGSQSSDIRNGPEAFPVFDSLSDIFNYASAYRILVCFLHLSAYLSEFQLDQSELSQAQVDSGTI